MNNRNVEISASILSADFTRLGDEVKAALAAGVDWIHFDVMDHHFVPNLSFGSVICHSLRRAKITAPIDVHLMVDNPEQYVEPFAKAGANLITFHPEAADNVVQCIGQIRACGMQVGLALNPDKPFSLVTPFLQQIDLLLLMSVYPGFAGQSFMHESLEKLHQARELINQAHASIRLGIDGGVKNSNITKVVAAGANFCIIGSGLFHTDNYQNHMEDIRAQIQMATRHASCS